MPNDSEARRLPVGQLPLAPIGASPLGSLPVEVVEDGIEGDGGTKEASGPQEWKARAVCLASSIREAT